MDIGLWFVRRNGLSENMGKFKFIGLWVVVRVMVMVLVILQPKTFSLTLNHTTHQIGPFFVNYSAC